MQEVRFLFLHKFYFAGGNESCKTGDSALPLGPGSTVPCLVPTQVRKEASHETAQSPHPRGGR